MLNRIKCWWDGKHHPDPWAEKRIYCLRCEKYLMPSGRQLRVDGSEAFWFGDSGYKIAGWTRPLVKIGDFIVADMQNGKRGRYNVVEVDNKRDPGDQYFATIEFGGYRE